MPIYGSPITIGTFSGHTQQQRYVSELSQLIDMSQRSKPDTLWHYTGSNVVRPILESNCMRFTHASSFTDEDEVNHALRFARIIIDTLLPSADGNLDKLLMKKIGDQMIDSNADSRWFVSCFTDNCESDFHWENYSSGFSGCCIGFDTKELIKFFSCSPNNRPLILKTIYDTQEMINFGSVLLALGIGNFKRGFGHFEDVDSTADRFLFEWGQHADPTSVMFKKEEFSKEKEWRLGRCIELSTCDDQPYTDKVGKRRWDLTRGYLSDSASHKLPINCVVIGRNSSLTVSEVRILLEKNGFTGVGVSKQLT